MLGIPFLEDALREQGLLSDDVKPQDGLEPKEEIENLEESFSDSDNEDSLSELYENIDKSRNNLSMVEGQDHAQAMDIIYKETLKHAQDLVDLGYNCEDRMRRGIFEQANNFYGRAIEAKNSKRDSQLKAMKLALEHRKLELEEKKLNAMLKIKNSDNNVSDDNPIMIDRNAIIKTRLEQLKNKD